MEITMDINTIVTIITNYVSIAALALFLLVFATNIIVEVVKGLFPKVPTNFVVVIVAITVTILALLIASAVLDITIMWYYAVGAVVLGIFVAYGAMFGFDKYKEAYEKLKAFQTE